MVRNTTIDIAEKFGLSVETIVAPGREASFRVYKGAKQIFAGSESGLRDFLAKYKDQKPGPYEGSMYGYKE